MNVYRLTIRSKSGSHFVRYIQAIIVMAEGVNEAEAIVTKWLADECRTFLIESERTIELLTTGMTPGVIDYFEDSDY